MEHSHLLDVDELTLQARSAQARNHIEEAVRCYKAGAFRACIVATWIAVVFDFVDKLRELDLSGDRQANQKLAEFERIRQSHDIKLALAFERNVPQVARDEFGLVSPQEFIDLQRLLEDRNRCAHPSMLSDVDVFSPSAELARLHLRNAVTHVLSQPPVQGRAALQRVIGDIGSPLFPEDARDAATVLGHGPLRRARPSLVRNTVVVLLKTLFRDNLNMTERGRHLAGLIAVRALHRESTDLALREVFDSMAEAVPDAEKSRVLDCVRALPDTWELLSPATHTRLENYVRHVVPRLLATFLPAALSIAELRPVAEERARQFTRDELESVAAGLQASAPRFVIELALERYPTMRSWDAANRFALRVLEPIIPALQKQDVRRLVAAGGVTHEVKHSFEWKTILRSTVARGIVTNRELLEFATEAGLTLEWLQDDAQSPRAET